MAGEKYTLTLNKHQLKAMGVGLAVLGNIMENAQPLLKAAGVDLGADPAKYVASLADFLDRAAPAQHYDISEMRLDDGTPPNDPVDA